MLCGAGAAGCHRHIRFCVSQSQKRFTHKYYLDKSPSAAATRSVRSYEVTLLSAGNGPTMGGEFAIVGTVVTRVQNGIASYSRTAVLSGTKRPPTCKAFLFLPHSHLLCQAALLELSLLQHHSSGPIDDFHRPVLDTHTDFHL